MKATTKSAPSFETAFAELESIVEAMESGDVPLADLLTRYEKATHLLKICEARLKDAELKIEQLKQLKDDSTQLTPFSTDTQT